MLQGSWLLLAHTHTRRLAASAALLHNVLQQSWLRRASLFVYLLLRQGIAIELRSALSLWQSSCLCLPRAEMTCVATPNFLVSFMEGRKVSARSGFDSATFLTCRNRKTSRGKKKMSVVGGAQDVERPRTQQVSQSTVSQMLGHPDSNHGFNKCKPCAICFPNVDEFSSLWRCAWEK